MGDGVHIYKCAPESLAGVWPLVAGWLEKSLTVAPPWWTLQDLYDLTMKGDYILWLITIENKACGVALAEFNQFPSALVCDVPWIGGKGMRVWLPALQELIEKWAREAGAKYLMGAGRRGWIRAAGMKEIGLILIKDLQNG